MANTANESDFSVIDTLTDGIVFTGSLEDCKRRVITDKTGFLQLCENFS